MEKLSDKSFLIRRAIKTKEMESIFENIGYQRVVLVRDVRKFLKELKMKIPDAYKDHVVFLIDKLAGEKLI